MRTPSDLNSQLEAHITTHRYIFQFAGETATVSIFSSGFSSNKSKCSIYAKQKQYQMSSGTWESDLQWTEQQGINIFTTLGSLV